MPNARRTGARGQAGPGLPRIAGHALRTILPATVLAFAPPVPSAAASERPENDVIAEAVRAVVSVVPQREGRPGNIEEPEGSGVVVGDGTMIVTADHVLGEARTVLVRTVDGAVIAAAVARRDAATDLALLVVDQPLPRLDFAEEPASGDQVCALGNAFGLGLSVTCGTVSATRRSGVGFNRIEDFVQTDAAVNPGMSGGALIDGDGRLVGMLSAIFTKQSDANIGVNFAASARLLEAALRRFRRPGPVVWPRLGATLRRHPARGETGQAGAVVVAMAPGSPAERAGLAPHDVILAVGGRPVDRPEDIAATLALAAGDTVPFLVVRAGGRLILEVPVAE